MRRKSRTPDQLMAMYARRQHGNVTRSQSLDAGLSADAIQRRLRKGALLPKHPGVYRLGHSAPSLESDYMAAVLACGDGARLSGLAAAHMHRLLKGKPPQPEVTAPTERRVRGVRTRRSTRTWQGEVMRWRNIPVSRPALALVEIAARLTPEELARACHEASVRHRTTPKQVEAVLARRPNSPGAGKLRRVLRGDVHLLLSRLEKRFLDHLRKIDRPLPRTNRPAGGRYVDCRWPEHRLTVELDSYKYHASRHAWEQDRHREREAYARGDAFRRYTWGDVFERPEQMLAEVCRLLPEEG